MRKPKPESFEKFYYTKVGLGEGCGCAERVIDIYNLNQLAGGVAPELRSRSPGFGEWLRRLGSKLGLVPSRR